MGYSLTRSDPADRSVVYFLARFKLARQVQAMELLDMLNEPQHA